MGYVVADDPDRPDHGTVYTTGDGGGSWQRVAGPGRMDLQAAQVLSASLLHAVGEGGAFLHSADGGASWALQAVGSQTDLVDLHFRTPTNGLAFARDGQVYRTGDGGSSWAPFADLTAALPDLSDVTAVDFFDGNRGFATVRRG